MGRPINEIKNDVKEIMVRHDEIMKLDNKEFLSDETTKELDYIHNRMIELTRELLREN